MSALLHVENLSVTFGAPDRRTHAVSDISFTLHAGQTLCLVGESGSGKSVTSMAVMGLLPTRGATIEAKRLAFNGEDLRTATSARLAQLRGKEMSMIFQDPMSSLNPALTIGYQIAEAVRLHEAVSRAEAGRRALDMLDRVRIPDARRRLGQYPHQLSGGMRQRVMIAMALACNPKVLIADEPTTALDVTVQAQILSLMDELKRDMGTAILLITHDLGVVAEMADEVAVMYAGRIVERGPVGAVFDHPSHGYTHGLLGAKPHRSGGERLLELPGGVPRLDRPIETCAFAPRCRFAETACGTEPVAPISFDAEHMGLCRRYAAVRAAATMQVDRHA